MHSPRAIASAIASAADSAKASAIAAIATIASANASAIDFLGTSRLFAARGALMAGGGL